MSIDEQQTHGTTAAVVAQDDQTSADLRARAESGARPEHFRPPGAHFGKQRSDAKITLTNINKDVCSVLGTWQLDRESVVA